MLTKAAETDKNLTPHKTPQAQPVVVKHGESEEYPSSAFPIRRSLSKLFNEDLNWHLHADDIAVEMSDPNSPTKASSVSWLSAHPTADSHLSEQQVGEGARFLRFAAVAWCLLCTRVLYASITVLEHSRFQLIQMYYQPLLVMVVMLWLWGLVLAVWSARKIFPSPLAVFELEDPRLHLSHTAVFQLAAVLTVLLLTNVTVFSFAAAAHLDDLATVQPVLAWAAPPAVLMLPLDVLAKPTRMFFCRTVWRILVPLQPISFADFFLADILTSLSKALSDGDRAVCSMMMGKVLEAAKVEECSSASWHVPFWLALPYLCRLFQCLRQFYDTKDGVALGNALKYFTAFPVIGLSFLKYHLRDEAQWNGFYRPLWLLSSVVNSSFSFYWDIVFDWDLSLLSGAACFAPRQAVGLRPELLYAPDPKGRAFLWYYWVVLTNLVLRISWAHKLSSHLRHFKLIGLAVSVLEAVRRFQWIFLRVEKQYLAMHRTHRWSQLATIQAPKEVEIIPTLHKA